MPSHLILKETLVNKNIITKIVLSSIITMIKLNQKY